VILEAKSLVKTLGTMQTTPIDEDASLEKIWSGVELEIQRLRNQVTGEVSMATSRIGIITDWTWLLDQPLSARR
jgi:hypothetical protein